jgi:hypothetical protein
MSEILRDAEIQVEDIDGQSLGILSTELIAFKAALLFGCSSRFWEPESGMRIAGT